MWAIYSLLSALFGGTNAILAKYSLRKNDSATVTALRTVVVLLIAWGAVVMGGKVGELANPDGRSTMVLLLSGVATALAWLFYFRAMEAGSVNHVAAVDKFTTVLTMLGGWLFLDESMNALKVVSMTLITVGILLMVEWKFNGVDKRTTDYHGRQKKGGWLVWSLLSVICASGSTLLSKSGVQAVDSRLALAIRTTVVLIVSGAAVFWKARKQEIGRIDGRAALFIASSGAATGFGWLFFFQALSLGDASVVQPLDKLSIFVTVVLSGILFGERLRLRAGIGLLVLSVGISLLVLV